MGVAVGVMEIPIRLEVDSPSSCMRTDGGLDDWPDPEETVQYGQPPVILDEDFKEEPNQCC